MENYISEIVQKAANHLQAEKDRLLGVRIVERVRNINEPINFNEEITRRFPRIKCEFNSPDQSEHWYWNDGTKEGLHLISFYQNEPKFNDPFTTIGLSYR